MKRRLYAKASLLSASLLLVIVGCATISFTPLAIAESTEYTMIAEMLSQINTTEIYNTVYALQNFLTRKYGTTENMAAAAYIYDRLSSIPQLDVAYQGINQNVIATLSGVNGTPDEIYIVGAHYDSISSDPNLAPGATDNGGGVAIVLEFARIMSQYSFNHSLKFAFWNNEEAGMFGSAEYAEYASSNGVNIDSSCYDPDGRLVLDIISNQQSNWISNLMTQHNALYGINFTLTYNTHTSSSDHEAFWYYGFPAVATQSESTGPAHSPQDTVDAISTLYAQKNGQLGMSVIAALAGVVQKLVPEFPSAYAVLLTALITGSCIIVSAQKQKALKHTLLQD